MSVQQVSSNASWGGVLNKYKATSSSLGGLEVLFNVFLPKESKSTSVPVLYYLAGLTCTEDTGAQKGGFLRDAAQHGIALVFPDTSPRGAGIEGEDADWDFGTAAGFYLNATNPKWSKYYNMHDYVTKELPSLIKSANLPIDTLNASIFGHSMGGHGALTLYLKNPGLYKSASAFAPIMNPVEAPWGKKAFAGPNGNDGYLTQGVEEGKEWDATELIKTQKDRKLAILADVGLSDNFYKQSQLLPENFIKVTKDLGLGPDQVNVRTHQEYDHSYWFIQTFGPDHIEYHAKFLKA